MIQNLRRAREQPEEGPSGSCTISDDEMPPQKRLVRRIFEDLVTLNHSLYITEHRTDETLCCISNYTTKNTFNHPGPETRTYRHKYFCQYHPWLLMSWLLASPGHQRIWYWICRTNVFFLCVISLWRNSRRCKYTLTILEIKSARQSSLGYLCNIRAEPTTNYNSNETYVILFHIYSCITY